MQGLAVLYITRLAQILDNCDYSQASSCGNTKDTIFPQVNADTVTLQKILQFAFGAIGFIAVVIIIIAGYRYILSQGNPQQHKQAWQTIMYAAIGLGFVMLAEIIVTFVLKQV